MTGAPPSDGQLFGIINDVGHDLSHGQQDSPYALPIDKVGPLKQYLECTLAVGFKLQASSAELRDVYVTVSRDPQHTDGRGNRAIWVGDADVSHLNDAHGWQEGHVFVEVVELREVVEGEIAAPVGVGVSVRVQSFDHVHEAVRSARQFTRDVSIETGLALVNRETCVPGWRLPIGADGLRRQVVKCCAEIVYSVTDDGRCLVRQRPVKDGSYDEARLIRIFLDNKSVWVVTEECFQEAFQITDMALCSRQL